MDVTNSQSILMPDQLAFFASGPPPSLTNFLNSIKTPSPPQSSQAENRQQCPFSCHMAVQMMTDSMGSTTNNPDTVSLDKILQLFQHASSLATRYITCSYCDNGCPRVMNLAMLHQRQANWLCEIARNPAVYLASAINAALRMSLGDYRPSNRDNILIKRIMLLSVARDVDSAVDEFHARAKSFEEKDASGESRLSEAGKLNLKWLLDVAANLKERLHTVKSILEQTGWGLDVGL